MAINTILKEVVPEWNLDTDNTENMELITDSVVQEVLDSMESDLIDFESDYD